MSERKLKICQYGVDCYRKNPIHFGEYSHPHLDQIYEKGINRVTGEYEIPDELFMSTEVVQIQLRLLEKLFPKMKVTVASATPVSSSATNSSVTNSSTSTTSSATASSVATTTSTSNPQTSTTSTDTNKRTNAEKSPETSNDNRASCSSSSSRSVETSSTSNAAARDFNSNLAKKQKLAPNIKDYIPVVLEKGRTAEKLLKAAPYNFFLTAITDCAETHREPLSITLQEILDESLGEIESSVQINFMVDIGWLLGHYFFAGILEKPLLVLYGDDMPELRDISKHKPQVEAVKVNMPTPFSTSHAKVMIFSYRDESMRIVVSTANMYEDDWHNRTQGLWISPRLPKMPEDADTAAGESPTYFREDFIAYLLEYKIPKLQPWIAHIRKTDFSAINVFFIGSAPGGFREGNRGHPFGHARVGSLLQKHVTPVSDKIPVICQSSSIGSLGPNVQSWIQSDLLNSFRKDSQPSGLRQFPPFKMIYPSFENVNNSFDGLLGGGCLPYGKNTNDKQPWLKDYLHQWRSNERHRSRAPPHIKSYTRVNLENQSIYWFLLTSANLSKAAWGAFNKNVKLQPCLRIYNYEAGVLFLPKFVTGQETFPLAHERDGVPSFPLPYDVPLTPYAPDDKPFLMDYLRM